ncbi:TIR domain-containing protein [Geomonas paludis]|uniref:TIR domain-containing protein n=1 Tax=Geomonas paludis TaxID=2740185 RepID=A0A6V8N1P8_9BACT|nr:TIR domain-containing protein [Geomonas paludis]UPU36305.1 TIR domain-containing protein [Geomonas paludis]GFO66405.1 hypothetical protein GMPD_43240 [Geomonas paludis]
MDSYDYDIAMSFAGEDRAIAVEVATHLEEAGVKVFYDMFEKAELWGKDLYEYLAEIYSNRARYCIMFLSENYSKKLWTNHERRFAQTRAFNERSDYILPVRIDQTSIPGIPDTIGYVDVKDTPTRDIASLVIEKLGNTDIISSKDPIKVQKNDKSFEILDLIPYCQTFPDSEGSVIPRDNIIDLICSMMSPEMRVIIIDGEDHIGKSTFMMQFALKYPADSISTFINPSSKYSYSPDFIRNDLYMQIAAALGEIKEQPETAALNYESKIFELHQRAFRQKKTYYFVIDGLDAIPSEDAQIRTNILSILPFGMRQFRFIIAGASSEIKTYLNTRSTPFRDYPLHGFTLDEAKKYFADANCDENQVEDIWRITKKPGYLATIKRLINNKQVDPGNLEDITDQLYSLYDIEWKIVPEKDNDLALLLAIVAFDKKLNNSSDLSRISKINRDSVEKKLRPLTFIKNEDHGGLAFVSDAFKRYVCGKLKSYKHEATSLIINDLFSAPGSKSAMDFLPSFLKESENYTQLIQYLSSEYFGQMVKCCQSLVPIMKTAEMGVYAADALRNDGELFRLGLQRTIISQLDDSAIWRSEIEANMAMGDYETALALAQSTTTKEDRLHAFAVIAKAKREKGLTETEELSDSIRQLHKEVDPAAIGKRAFEIAEDLFFSHPELAIDFAERAGSPKDASKSLEQTLSKISLSALGEGAANQGSPVETLLASNRIKDPSLRRFLESASIILGEYDASKVLKEVSEFENKQDAIFLLKRWVMANQTRQDSGEVILKILDLMITTSDYTPNATDFKNIAAPLLHIPDPTTVKALISKFDSQKAIIEPVGPTEDYVKLEITLATAAFKNMKEEAVNRFVESYFYIMSLEDVVTKAACLSFLYSRIKLVDKEKILEQKEHLHSLLPEEILEAVEQIINTVAYQFKATKSVIKSLAKCDKEMALKIIEKLNTEPTRDACYYQMTKAMMVAPFNISALDDVLKITKLIKGEYTLDRAIVTIVDGLLNHIKKQSLNAVDVEIFGRLISKVRSIDERCRLACLSFNLLNEKAPLDESIRSRLLHIINNALDEITIPWIKINTVYKIVRTVAKSDLEVAKEFAQKCSVLKKENTLGSESAAVNYLSTIYLALRAFSGLIPKSIFNDEDVEGLFELIEVVNSKSDQARLYSVLTIYFYNNKNYQWPERIVYEKIRYLLEDVKGEELEALVVNVSPAIYSVSPTLADTYIQKLATTSQDEAYFEICSYILKKTAIIDPFEDSRGFVYKCEFFDYIKICNVLEKIDSDHLIYVIVDDITTSIKKQKHEFTRPKKEELARKLLEIVNKKLPNPRFINHNGYKIICEAAIGRISLSVDWSNLVTSAQQITNTADRCLVLTAIYECMPNKVRDKYLDVLPEARSLVDSIPSIFDQISRMESLADSLKEIDPALSRECLRQGMAATLKCNDPDVVITQKRIVDLASKIEPAIAASLAKIYDDDPARIKQSQDLKNHLKLLEMKSDIINDAVNNKSMKAIDLEKLPTATWRALASLNAGMSDTIKIEKVRELVKVASGMSMDMAYPIMCYSIQNIVNRYSKTDQATTIVRPTFEAILLTSKLCMSMSSRAGDVHTHAIKVATQSSTTSVLIKSGERKQAIDFFKRWLVESLADSIKICDPYFGVDDLEILAYIRSVNPSCKVYIVTSKQHQDKEYGKVDLGDKYNLHWRLNISENDPPETEITVVGTASTGQLPIHDRWIVTGDCGVRIGTSINALGRSRDSEISLLSSDEAKARGCEIDLFINRERKEHNGEKIKYSFFTL